MHVIMKSMRTTVEITNEQRAQLLEIAGRRGEKGFSGLVREALSQYLKKQAGVDALRKRVLALKGSLDASSSKKLIASVTRARRKWR